MKKRITITLALTLLFLSACEKNAETTPTITLDEKIGQMLLIGFRGATTEDVEAHIVQDIEERHLGGVILYERDVLFTQDDKSLDSTRNVWSPTQVTELVSYLKSKSSTPLFVAIDEEGGIISRLQTQYGFTATKSAQYLGDLDNIDTTAYWADLLAHKVGDVGINLNFAPVVDLNINPQSPAIGNIERSFSAESDIVVKHASIYIDQHHANHVLTALKHCPGHGSATSDSHLGVTDVTDTWTVEELSPYTQLIAQGKCDMIMTAHVFNRTIDENYPATLSTETINQVRETTKWKGVIISDDMMMNAIDSNYGLKTAIEKSINAGVDILIFSNNSPNGYRPDIAEEAIALINELIDEGKITTARIDEAYDRIVDIKSRL